MLRFLLLTIRISKFAYEMFLIRLLAHASAICAPIERDDRLI
jgi:hypothetical protein